MSMSSAFLSPTAEHATYRFRADPDRVVYSQLAQVLDMLVTGCGSLEGAEKKGWKLLAGGEPVDKNTTSLNGAAFVVPGALSRSPAAPALVLPASIC